MELPIEYEEQAVKQLGVLAPPAFFACLSLAFLAYGEDDVRLQFAAAVLVPVVVVDLVRLAVGRRARVQLTPDGLTYKRVWRSPLFARWQDIESVRADGNFMWGAIFTWVRIRGRRGRVRIRTASLPIDGDALAFKIRAAGLQYGAEIRHENPDKDWD